MTAAVAASAARAVAGVDTRSHGRIASRSFVSLTLVCAVALAGACGATLDDHHGVDPQVPVRGVILISLDTLRADHLGAYGYHRDTSPELDRLARRGVLFEHALAQYPSTLTSHMTMLTGLYPAQHGVYPPDSVLDAGIASLAERLSDAGFRTAGFTEGGFIGARFGFDRGFDVWSDDSSDPSTDIEATFARGLEFLRGLADSDRFFLLLHTYAVHSPYEPPSPFRGRFWSDAPPDDAFPSGGHNLRAVNAGRMAIGPDVARYFEARYDESIAYADHVVGGFLDEVDRAGWRDEAAVVITSDHGEEFLEHDRLAHTQVYPESLHVPLILLIPGITTSRTVHRTVELVDVAPTVLDLVGAPVPESLAGSSLLRDIDRPPGSGEAYGEVREGGGVRTVVADGPDGRYQLVERRPRMDPEGRWVERELRFHLVRPASGLMVRSFHQPRRVEVSVAGGPPTRTEVGLEWCDIRLESPGSEVAEVRIETDGCVSPRLVGRGEDDRCLGVQVRGDPLVWLELYDLERDPAASSSVVATHGGTARALWERMLEVRHEAPERSETLELTATEKDRLRALGYLD